MKLTKEERQEKIKEQDEAYYSLRNELDSLTWSLGRINEGRTRKYEFKLLKIAINLTLEQIRKDHDRYVKRIRIKDANEEVNFMQKALNREKEKNAILEKKIEEAKTSSGLFIDFARKKLGL